MKQVPFYANSDATHCFQAAFKMVLKYFRPNEDYSFEQLEVMSDKKPGLSTWPQRMLINLKQLGLEVSMVEGFDPQSFIADGATYLVRAFGDEVANWQVTNSDIASEQKNYQAALSAGVDIQQRIPELEELKNQLNDHTLLVATVNSRKLNGKTGYSGHAVVIFAADDESVTMHDPGLPAQADRRVLNADFLAAWSDPTIDARSYIKISTGEPSR